MHEKWRTKPQEVLAFRYSSGMPRNSWPEWFHREILGGNVHLFDGPKGHKYSEFQGNPLLCSVRNAEGDFEVVGWDDVVVLKASGHMSVYSLTDFTEVYEPWG